MSAALSRDRIEKMLVGKLEAEVSESGRGHRFYTLRIDGAVVARTKVSTGTKHQTIGDNLVSAMAKQCRVSNKQFVDLVNCSMSRAQWVQRLRDQHGVP